MPRYAITEKAGRFVAGQTNTGVGSVLTLTEKQAEHEVRLCTLMPVAETEAPPPAQDVAQGGEEVPKAPLQRRGKKAAPAPAQAPAEGEPDADGEGDSDA